jgi:hypothetical protein
VERPAHERMLELSKLMQQPSPGPVQLIRPYSLLDLSAGSIVVAGSGHAMPSLLATAMAVGDITAVVDYRTLQPFQRPISIRSSTALSTSGFKQNCDDPPSGWQDSPTIGAYSLVALRA